METAIFSCSPTHRPDARDVRTTSGSAAARPAASGLRLSPHGFRPQVPAPRLPAPGSRPAASGASPRTRPAASGFLGRCRQIRVQGCRLSSWNRLESVTVTESKSARPECSGGERAPRARAGSDVIGVRRSRCASAAQRAVLCRGGGWRLCGVRRSACGNEALTRQGR